jgi:hypothetical protein
MYRFLDDLDRWRHILKDEDKLLYDDIIFALWEKRPSGCPPYSHTNNILYFQQLFQNLVDATDVHNIPLRNGKRLHSIQTQYTDSSHSVTPSVNNVDYGQKPPEKPPDIYEERWKDTDGEVVMLAATAIFGTIIAFLLRKCI